MKRPYSFHPLLIWPILNSTRASHPAMDSAQAPAATPEVEPVTYLLIHPLLQDPLFLAAVGGLLLILVLFSGAFQDVRRHIPFLSYNSQSC